MGAVAKGVASLFGGRKRRQTEADTKDAFETAERNVEGFTFENKMAGVSGRTYTPTPFDAFKNNATVGTMGARTDVGQVDIGSAAGYSDKVQGYRDQLQDFTAKGTSVQGLARGADTGLTNMYNNLQVSTAGSELAAQEADQSLAASQDLAAQAGTGAGGATALAAAAAKSKAGISANIDKQVRQNEMMRARGESELQRAQLAQGNLASSFDLRQDQFNIGAQNQAAQFNAQAANQAARFGADAQNQAARFDAQSANQFTMAQFGADTARERANAASANQFARTEFGATNQFALANMAAQNQGEQFNVGNQIAADRFAAQTDIRAKELAAQGDMSVQSMQYGRQQDILNRRAGQFQAAKDARAAATGDLIGGVGGLLSAAAPGLGSLIGGGSFGDGYNK